MAKTLVIDSEEGTRVPFLRGILTHSLQEVGLEFEQAYDLATSLRDDLSGQTRIESTELRELVAGRLRKSHGDIARRYLSGTEASDVVMVSGDGDARPAPFSAETHRKSLEFCGMTDSEARDFSRAIGRHLVARNRKEVRASYLGRLTYRLLSKEVGMAAARRYLVWRDFCKSGIPLLLLIGGAPGSGKSSVATALASRLDIFRTQSTDMLREVMRVMIPERLLPVLHRSSFEAWREFPDADRADDEEECIASGYRRQTDLLSVSCEAVVQRAVRERVSMVLEGVHIEPSMVSRLREFQGVLVVPIMLAVLKQKVLRERIRGRGGTAPRRRSGRYLENFGSIWHLQSYLLSEADKSHVPIVVNDNKEATLLEILHIIVDTLAKELKPTVDQVFPDHG